MNDDKRAISETTDGQPPRPGHEHGGAPAPINPRTGQHEAYWILSAEERAKGFVRPVRRSYKHVGPAGPRYPLRDLTDEERERYRTYSYVKFETYPEETGQLGRYWTHVQLGRVGAGCGAVTSMSQDIAETYARDPRYYGSTFCVQCRVHLPVGEGGEFVWIDDGSRVGT